MSDRMQEEVEVILGLREPKPKPAAYLSDDPELPWEPPLINRELAQWIERHEEELRRQMMAPPKKPTDIDVLQDIASCRGMRVSVYRVPPKEYVTVKGKRFGLQITFEDDLWPNKVDRYDFFLLDWNEMCGSFREVIDVHRYRQEVFNLIRKGLDNPECVQGRDDLILLVSRVPKYGSGAIDHNAAIWDVFSRGSEAVRFNLPHAESTYTY